MLSRHITCAHDIGHGCGMSGDRFSTRRSMETLILYKMMCRVQRSTEGENNTGRLDNLVGPRAFFACPKGSSHLYQDGHQNSVATQTGRSRSPLQTRPSGEAAEPTPPSSGTDIVSVWQDQHSFIQVRREKNMWFILFFNLISCMS